MKCKNEKKKNFPFVLQEVLVRSLVGLALVQDHQVNSN